MTRAAIIALAASLVGCGPATLLDCRLPAGPRVTVVHERAGSFVTAGGRRFGPYRDLAIDTLRADEAGHVAWAARGTGGWSVVLDGAPGPGWDGVAEITLGRSGLVYAASRSGRWAVVSRRDVGAWHEGIAAGSVRACEPGAAYIARDRTSAVVVVADREIGPFRAAGGLVVSERCDFFAFAFEDGRGVYLQRDGGRQGPFFDVAQIALAGGRVAATVLDREGWRVLDGTREGEPFAAIGKLVLANNGSRLAYAARREQRDWLVVDGERRYGPFPKVAHTSVTLSDDGAALAFVATVGGKQRVFIDGAPIDPPFDEVGDLALSPNGHRWAAIAVSRGAPVVVVDGVEQALSAMVGSLAFDELDRWGAVASDPSRRGLFFVLDGRRGPGLEPVEIADLVRSQGIVAPADLRKALRARVRSELRDRHDGGSPRSYLGSSNSTEKRSAASSAPLSVPSR